WLLSPMIDTENVDSYGMVPSNAIAGKFADLPIVTPSNQLTESYMVNSYPKPALGYLYIKEMLGDSLVFKALHHYIRNWNGKHPQPFDFFNAMNTGSGRNLDWFWKRWFFEPGFPDLEIAEVKQQGNDGEITIVSKGSKPVPIDLKIEFANGSV